MLLILSFVTSASYSSIYPSKLAMFSNDKSLFYLFITYRRSTLSSSGSDYRNPERPRLIIYNLYAMIIKASSPFWPSFTSANMYITNICTVGGWSYWCDARHCSRLSLIKQFFFLKIVENFVGMHMYDNVHHQLVNSLCLLPLDKDRVWSFVV